MRTVSALVFAVAVLNEGSSSLKLGSLKLGSLAKIFLSIDLSNGAYELSTPFTNDTTPSYLLSFGPSSMLVPRSVAAVETTAASSTSASMMQRAKRITRTAVKKIPDNVLLGLLVLIATELIKREIILKESYPLGMRTAAETALRELEAKIEYLAATNWALDPFIRKEFDQLQTQPLEVLDKYLATGAPTNLSPSRVTRLI